jgi:CheY-like chemotaxis protein
MTNNKRILIADDDQGIIDMMTVMLEFEGYHVKTVLDGKEVLGIKGELPDLLLLDIWMSGSDGREICKLLKQDPATHALPVLLISASKDIEDSALAAGADGFIAKPFEMDDLLQKIEQHIQH